MEDENLNAYSSRANLWSSQDAIFSTAHESKDSQRKTVICSPHGPSDSLWKRSDLYSS
jgi:hypothetical protein